MNAMQLRGLARAAMLAVVLSLPSGLATAGVYELTIDQTTIDIGGTQRTAMTVNGTVPGPLLRWREGEDVELRVTNRLKETSSIHWHGILLPPSQDGVPGISPGFHGIAPGETFTYRFRVRQGGTYWYHSHSGTQEQSGVYGPIVITPAGREPFRADREHVIVLSDWTDEDPRRVIANLKAVPGYYNFARRTGADLFRDMANAKDPAERAAIWNDRLDWAEMRMDPTDLADVTGYTFLANGAAAGQSPVLSFAPGERVRLRFVNASAMTYFDVRIPGLRMTVVAADGNNVEPVPVDEFRIAVAETYDVIVRPSEDKPYAVLAESMDRAGFARAVLATRADADPGPLPEHRPRAVLTMADMGSSFGSTGLDRGTPAPETDAPGHVAPMEMDHGGHAAAPAPAQGAMPTPPAMDHAAMGHGPSPGAADHAAMGHGTVSDTIAHDVGAPPGAKVLSYRDLKALGSPFPAQEPDRVVEMRLTGNMERYFWSINGRKFSEAQPIVLRLGERVRFRFINETMMNHPMHLHGMWMLPDVGNGAKNPLKHVVNIKPGTTFDVDVPADAEGEWAFHCHLLFHMETGMMRKVVVQRQSASLGTEARP
ncbi:MAG: copper resistance system multicopper oxidase [Alphaproteobacteria bacterium]